MAKAHPVAAPESTAAETDSVSRAKTRSCEAAPAVFADGCSFHKLVWLFFIGAFLGDITETIFCYVTSGILMSRSSVVYGPFSVVWGLGVVVLTMMLHYVSAVGLNEGIIKNYIQEQEKEDLMLDKVGVKEYEDLIREYLVFS